MMMEIRPSNRWTGRPCKKKYFEVTLFNGNSPDDPCYQLGSMAYTNYVTVDNCHVGAYFHIFWSATASGRLYSASVDDEGNKSELEGYYGSVFGTTDGSWYDTFVSAAGRSKRMYFCVKNTSGVAANYNCKLAVMGLR